MTQTAATQAILAPARAATEKSRLTQAAGQVTGTLFCSYHQGHADAASGAYLLRNKVKRWMCARCMAKRNIKPVPVQQ